jgi:outer membrane protein TolC
MSFGVIEIGPGGSLNTQVLSHIFVTLFTLLTVCETASAQMSFREALRTSFERNPVSLSGDLRLEAQEMRVRAAKLAMLPSGALSFSRGSTKSRFESDGNVVESKSRYQGWSGQLSLNLFSGGADYYSAKAAQAQMEAMAASHNSTDALLPYTRGALASDVYNVYVELVVHRTMIKFLEYKLEILQKYLKATQVPDEINTINNALKSTRSELIDSQSAEKKLRDAFEYLVKVPAPEQLDNFDILADSFTIPPNSEEAIPLALEKSPELAVARKILERSRYDQRSERARMFSPRVDLSLYSGGNSSYSTMDSFSKDKGVTLTLSIPLEPANIAYSSATAKEIQATKTDLDRVHDRLQYGISKELYPTLYEFIDRDGRFQDQLKDYEKQLEEILTRMEQGQAVKMEYALDVLSDFHGRFNAVLMNKMSIANMKFSIQKTIGTLFDDMGLNAYIKVL